VRSLCRPAVSPRSSYLAGLANAADPATLVRNTVLGRRARSITSPDFTLLHVQRPSSQQGRQIRNNGPEYVTALLAVHRLPRRPPPQRHQLCSPAQGLRGQLPSRYINLAARLAADPEHRLDGSSFRTPAVPVCHLLRYALPCSYDVHRLHNHCSLSPPRSCTPYASPLPKATAMHRNLSLRVPSFLRLSRPPGRIGCMQVIC
jgi:hypothetical protein